MIYLDIAGKKLFIAVLIISIKIAILILSVKIYSWQYEVNRTIVKQSIQPVFIVSSWICTSGKIYTQFRVEYTKSLFYCFWFLFLKKNFWFNKRLKRLIFLVLHFLVPIIMLSLLSFLRFAYFYFGAFFINDQKFIFFVPSFLEFWLPLQKEP